MATRVQPLQQQQGQCEFLLFGSVSDANHGALLHRLRGLCDYSSAGGVQFADRDVTLKIEAGTNTASRLRVRQSMGQPEAPWVLSYHGQLELGDANRPAAIRTCINTGCSHNLLECLKELGFWAVSEVILRGQLFKKGSLYVKVFKIYQPNESGDPSTAQAISTNYLVEMSALALSGQDNIGADMKSFAEHLKPIVVMEKTDGLR